MASPHVIRLRGPWEFESLPPVRQGSPTDAPVRGRIKLPAAEGALPEHLSGPMRYSRRFQRPTGLGTSERVWLVISVPDPGVASLNGQLLGGVATGQRAEFDVTDALAPQNLLAVELAHSPPSDVHLEIRAPGQP